MPFFSSFKVITDVVFISLIPCFCLALNRLYLVRVNHMTETSLHTQGSTMPAHGETNQVFFFSVIISLIYVKDCPWRPSNNYWVNIPCVKNGKSSIFLSSLQKKKDTLLGESSSSHTGLRRNVVYSPTEMNTTAIKAAICRPQSYCSLLKTAFFHSTPVLERKRHSSSSSDGLFSTCVGLLISIYQSLDFEGRLIILYRVWISVINTCSDFLGF